MVQACFLPYEWYEDDVNDQHVIGVFAFNKQSETCYIRIPGFRPRFYIEPPTASDDGTIQYKWTPESAKHFIDQINRLVPSVNGKAKVYARYESFNHHLRFQRYTEDLKLGAKPQILVSFDTLWDLRNYRAGLYELSSYKDKKQQQINIFMLAILQ